MVCSMNSSSDSEFDYEADEQEKLLYMQLYFGENADPLDNPDGKSLDSSFDKPCVISSLPSNHIPTSNVLDGTSDFREDGQVLSMISNEKTPKDDKDKTTVPNPLGISPDSFLQNDGESPLETPPVALENAVDIPIEKYVSLQQRNAKKQEQVCNSVNVTKPFKRKRNMSQESIGSISGSEPLDKLYLLDSDDDFSPMNLSQITEISENISDEDSRYSLVPCRKQAKQKTVINVSDSDYSLDEEVFVLPTRPKTYDSVEIDSDTEGGNSKDSIEIVQENLKSRKMATPRQIKSKSPKEKATHEMAVVLSSEDSDSQNVSAVSNKKRALFCNLKLRPTPPKVTRKSTSLHFVKSKVIFSKDRPLSERRPSCPTWTEEMTRFYDSDISDEFTVEEVHASQSDLSRNWRICQEDKSLVFQKRKTGRYFERRCPRCKEPGHTLKKCPRVPHCLYCGSTAHPHYRMCPHICCLRCGGEPHGYCFLTDKQRICSECGNSGHVSKLCPDLWRRFHATTSGSVPVVPKATDGDTKSRPRSCWNCGGKGHYGHECKKHQFSRYVAVSTEVFSYDSPIPPKVLSNERPVSTKGLSNKRPVSTKVLNNESSVSTKVLNNERPISTKVLSNERPISTKVLSNERPISTKVLSNERPVSTKVLSNETPDKITTPPMKNIVIISTTRIQSEKKEAQLIRLLYVPHCMIKILKRKKEKRLNNVRSWSHAQITFVKKDKQSLKIQGSESVVETATRLLKEIRKELIAIQLESSIKPKTAPTLLPESPPLSLPKKPKKAAAAIARMMSVKEFDKTSPTETLKDILKFFTNMGVDGPSAIPPALKNNKDIAKRVRQLSKILYPICRFGQLGKDFEKLLKLKIDLKRRIITTKDEVFKSLKPLYSKIANPPIVSLPKLVADAQSFLAKKEKQKKIKQKEHNGKRKQKENNRNTANPKKPKDSFESNSKEKLKKMENNCKSSTLMNGKDSFESNPRKKRKMNENNFKTTTPKKTKKKLKMIENNRKTVTPKKGGKFNQKRIGKVSLLDCS